MLKNLRVAVSIPVFGLLTFYFLDFADLLPAGIGALGRIQFVPALLSANIVIIACLIICALLFGRVYCSFICPMGIFQDIVSRLSRAMRSATLRRGTNRGTNGKGFLPGKKYAYRKNNPALRWSIVVAGLVLFFAGATMAAGILDPYSAYGRMAVHLFKPAYMFANNILVPVLENFGNYTLYKTQIAVLSGFSLGVALLTFMVVSVLAWTKGRLYCNTVCPVGTILGFVNKFSLFKIRLNSGECVSCGICAAMCKASCIDAKAKSVDYSRCVNCFNCINSCNKKAISFAMKNKPAKPGKPAASFDKGRREFLLLMLGAAAAHKVFAQSISFNVSDRRGIAISPPGSVSADRLLRHCTSCHLCISKCPSKVLKPSFMEYGLAGMMIPMVHYERGFCNYDCTVCAGVCPSHALLPLTKEQKHRLQIGRVAFTPEICVVYTNGTSCGACSEHCPTQAVTMVPYKDGLTIPFINADICVGCGACEYICPVRPQRAIHVEGNEIHREAKAFTVEKGEEKEITDFGF